MVENFPKASVDLVRFPRIDYPKSQAYLVENHGVLGV
jgi:hypothetical protein